MEERKGTKENLIQRLNRFSIVYLIAYGLSFFVIVYSYYLQFRGGSPLDLNFSVVIGSMICLQAVAIIGFITKSAFQKRFSIAYYCNFTYLFIIILSAKVQFWAGAIQGLAVMCAMHYIIFCMKKYTATIRIETEKQLIDQQKQEENELLHLYSNAIEQAPLSIVITDKGGFIQYVNPYFTKVTGYTLAEAKGKHTRILKSPNNQPQLYEELWQNITQGENWIGEFTNIDKNGEEFYERAFISPIVNDSGAISHYVSIKEDITEARRLKNTIDNQASFIAQLIDVIPNSIFYVDKNDIFLGANEEFKKVYGVDTQVHQGESFKDLPWLGAFRYQRFVEMRQESVNAGKPVIRQIMSQMNGKETPFLYCVNAYYTSKGHVDGYIGMMTDISELKENEKKLQNALIEANSATEAKSMFLANMSHEIRTPMNAVIGMSYLAMQTQLSEKQRDYLVKINTAATSLLGIVNEVLDFSKIEAGRLSIENIEFQLDQVILKSIDLMLPKAREKNIEMIYHLSCDVTESFLGDPLRLGQVITNLLSNAVKFTNKGEICIDVTREEQNDQGVLLKFAISDTGIGISKEGQSKLFEAFTQSDNSITRQYGGTGLGLTICKKLIELMEGEVWLTSEENVGSTFYFTAWFGHVEKVQVKKCVTLQDIQGMRTLVADDNTAAGEILKEYMEYMGAKVDLAGSGEQALQLLEKSEGEMQYQLLLIDWKMSGLDGIETVKRLKPLGKNKPLVVFVTAYDIEELKKSALGLEVSAYLTKPVTHSSLYDTIVSIFADTFPLSAKEAFKLTGEHEIGGIRILLAEDHEVNQQIARELLELQGCVVDIAKNGRRAVELFECKVQTYDLIFMDIQMPEMDGFEAARKIRELDSQIPIIAMTARSMKGEKERCRLAGMNDTIAKPIDPPALAQMVSKWSNRKGVKWNEADPMNEEFQTEFHQKKNHLLNLYGINVEEGLLRAAENIGLYESLLYKFAMEQKNTMLKITNSISRHELLEWEGHLLGGVAGNIGAMELYRLAQQLETTAKAGGVGMENIILQLQKEYAQVSASIFAVIQREENRGEAKLAEKECLVTMQKLMQMMQKGDPEALAYFSEAGDVIKMAVGEDVYKKATYHIDRYEFDEALAVMAPWEKTNDE